MTPMIKASATDKSSWLARAREVFDIELEAVTATRDAIGESFADAVELLKKALECGGRIAVTGVGKNLPVAEKMSATMASTGSTSFVLNPVQAMHGDLGMLADRDCVIALSFSGASEEILRVLPAIRRRDIRIIGIAGVADCPMAVHCDVMLEVPARKEADPFDMAPTASTTATLAIGDAIAMTLLDIRGFRREDYARLHPAGAICRTLLTRVTDVMRSGERLVALPETATVRDALVAMTKAQSGAAFAVNGEGKLLGIFTDGDLRRLLASSPEPLERPLGEVMTRNPLSIGADKMATDLLEVFSVRHIDDLPVVDADGRLVGEVDISDLPTLKVL